MSYTMMLRSGLLLFLIGYPLCLNRYIISAIFFVIRCALVTRKKFYFFLSAVGRRIEWVFSWVVYMHIRMESAATGIIFDCVWNMSDCVSLWAVFSTQDLSYKLQVYLPTGGRTLGDILRHYCIRYSAAPMGYTDDLFFCCCGIPSSKAWRKDCTQLGTTSIVV